MQTKSESNKIDSFDTGEINLFELFQVLLAGKWTIIFVTTFACVVVLIYSLALPNIYESRVLLVPNDSNNQSGLAKNYGSLASIAGVSLPSNSNMSNSKKAIKKLTSLSFFESNILPNIFLPDLVAIDSWNSELNFINYDNEIYDQSKNVWVLDKKLIPSAQESFYAFQSHVSFSDDNVNNFLTVKVKHQSPFIAKEWANLLIDQINDFYRQKDKKEAERAVDYLNTQIARTKLSEIKEVIAELLQQETQKLTLIEANEYYVYEYIDPPAVMEKKSEPSRAFICILGALIGIIFGAVIVLLRNNTINKLISS